MLGVTTAAHEGALAEQEAEAEVESEAESEGVEVVGWVVRAVEATGAEMAETTDAATGVETAVAIEPKHLLHPTAE